MKNLFILFVSVVLLSILMVSCSSSSPNTSPSETHEESSTSISEESETTTTDTTTPDITAETSPSSEVSSFDRQEVLHMIYDEMPVISPLGRTPEYRYEYRKVLREIVHMSEENIEDHLDRFLPTALLIDPFSETPPLLEDAMKISIGALYGDVLEQFGLPNFGIWYLIEWEKKTSDSMLESFWLLDNGEILHITCDGPLETNNYISPGTSIKNMEIWGRQYNLYVNRYEIISVQDLIGSKDYYTSRSYEHENVRFSSDLKSAWLGEWPEIFVTKYGYE